MTDAEARPALDQAPPVGEIMAATQAGMPEQAEIKALLG